MPPPARGCLRSDGLAPGGQAGVAGAALARREQQGQTRAARADGQQGVLPRHTACSKSRRVQQGQPGATRADGRGGGPGREAGRGGMRRHATDMPPPARGCLRSDGLAPGGQAGVAGAALARREQQGQAGVAGAALARRVQQEQTRAARADACSKGSRGAAEGRGRQSLFNSGMSTGRGRVSPIR